MERFVTVAFGFGKRAAIEIDLSLHSAPRASGESSRQPVPFDAINTHYHPRAARAKQQLLEPCERQDSFFEVELPLRGDDALDEARRCFSCGKCTHCDNCFYYCPDMAIDREDGGYSVNEDYCKGCGLCVRECPTGAIIMRQEV